MGNSGREERLRVRYRLRCGEGEQPRDKARDIAYEQTVELPPACVGEAITERVVGRVESLEVETHGVAVAEISYATEWIGGDAAQLLNLLFGNISLKRGILIEDVVWPASLLETFGGPAFGVAGLRRLASAPAGRPLLCAALKPVGSSAHDFADLCHRLASGGIDVIKDDHGLANQDTAPYDERVARCAEAVARANRSSGRTTLYFPNVTGPADTLAERLETAKGAGCRGVMLSPFLSGVDALQRVKRRGGLAVLAHPAWSGALFRDDHGIAPGVLLGDVLRVLGADGAIYPNVGGRFPFDDRTCLDVNDRLRRPLGALAPTMPFPGGGIDVKLVPHWLAQYGPDTALLIGGSLLAQEDLEDAVRRLVRAVRENLR